MKQQVLKLTLSKTKQIVFLLLLTTIIFFLLSNTKVYNFLQNWHETSFCPCFMRLEVELKTSPSPPNITRRHSTTSTPQSKPDVQRCSYFYLSPENIKEGGRELLDSITWPKTQPLPSPFNLNVTTNGLQSSFSIVPRRGGWRVGDELTVMIQLRDFNGNPKKGGGDFIVSRLRNQELGAGVAGQVKDNLDGTFTAVFPLLWNGTADIEVTLVQTSESITVLKRLPEEQPDRVYFTSEFRSGSVRERTMCNVCLDPDKYPVCNFTDIYTGEQWFCVKPNKLDCNSWYSHNNGPSVSKISKEEETLFQKFINLKVPIKPSDDKRTVTILPKAGGSKEVNPGPSGYYYRNKWLSLQGQDFRRFDDASAITSCLNGKRLHFYGDSTIKQYYEYITTTVTNLQMFDNRVSVKTGPLMAVDHANDIVVTYLCHNTPLRFFNVPVSQLRYVANEMDGLAGGPDYVVVVGIWAHLTSYPLEVYYQRLMTIRRAAQRLLHRAPETKVIVRSGNAKQLHLGYCLTHSDWYTLQRDKVLRAVFKDTGVIILDAWDMVLAHDPPHTLHPPPEVIKEMIDMILSYTCPEKS